LWRSGRGIYRGSSGGERERWAHLQPQGSGLPGWERLVLLSNGVPGSWEKSVLEIEIDFLFQFSADSHVVIRHADDAT
jgi:hypothetical protein